jgi:hypothetical protein
MVKNNTYNQGDINMSLANKFGIPQGLLDASKAALDEANEYQKKVQAHMAKKGIKSMSDMTADQKKKFFNELDAMHTAKHEEVESVEEELKGDMHPGAKKVLKHIKPEHQDKYKPYLKKGVYRGDYKDRAAVLSAAERAKHTNEEYFAEEEELEELAISPAARRDAYERQADYHRSRDEDDVSPSADLHKHKLKTLHRAHELHSMHQGTADTSNKDEKSDFHNATKTMRRIEKHVAAKYGKKEAGRLQRGDYREEVSLDDFSPKDIESFMQTEDYNQLDELSKNTLASYIKKRSHDVAAMGAVTRKHAMDSEAARKDQNYSQAKKSNDKSNRAFMKGWKHRENIGKAVDKLTKEEFEFIESLNAGTAKE